MMRNPEGDMPVKDISETSTKDNLDKPEGAPVSTVKISDDELDACIRERAAALAEANDRLLHEITTHRETERKLLLLHQLVNETSEAVFIIDPITAAILEVNAAGCFYAKYGKQELLKLRAMDILFVWKDPNTWHGHVDELRQKKTLVFEDFLRCKDDGRLPVEISIRYVEYEGDAYIFAILRDVSSRREMEMHIRMTNDILRLSSANISLEEYVEGLGRLIRKWCECSDAIVRVNNKSAACAETLTCMHSSDADPHPFFLEQMGHADCACFRALNGDAIVDAEGLLTAGNSFFCQDTASFFAGLSAQQQTAFHASCLLHRFSSVAMIPIAYQGTILGIIVFGDERKDMLSWKTVEVLESLSSTVAEVIRRHLFEKELKQSREQLRMLTAHIEEAREEERIRIAREIHDQLGQILTALKIDLSWLHDTYAHDLQHGAKTRDMLALVNRTIFTVKKIVTDLRPSVLDHLGIIEAIEWQASEVQKLTGIRCAVDSLPRKIILEKNLMTHVFRIFQEIMTNVVRHSEASSVTVSVVNSSDGFNLSVVDDGRGILEKQISAPTAYGIMGMRERAHSMGGTIQISGIEPHGTMVSLWIPKAGSRDADRDV